MTAPKISAGETLAFLQSLWGGKPDGAKILVFNLAGKRSHWFDAADAAAAAAASLGTTSDVYVGAGLAPKDYGPAHRCPSEEICGITGLWADIDLKSPAHDKNLPTTIEEALSLIPAWIEPTWIVATGNGIHIWLLFREPWMFESAAERAAAYTLELRLQTMLADRAKQRGWTFERLADLARVLRIPGTANFKDARNPRMIRSIANGGPRRNPSEIIELLDEMGVPDPEMERLRAAGPLRFTVRADAGVPENVIGALLLADRTFKATWEQTRRNLRDSSPSGYELALANIGVIAGMNDQQIVDLLIAWRHKHGHPPKLRPDYFARTLHRVRSTVHIPEPAEEPSAPPPAESAPRSEGPRRAALDAIRDLTGLKLARLAKVRGDEPSYVIALEDGREGELPGESLYHQKRFSEMIFSQFELVVPALKDAQWKTVLRYFTRIFESIDRGPDLTSAGALDRYLASYLAQTPFLTTSPKQALSMQRLWPLVREGCICVSATDLRIHVDRSFHDRITLRELTAMLVGAGARTWRERVGRTNEQSRWLLPADRWPADEYTQQGKGEEE